MPDDSSRRDFLKKATYVSPMLLSFHAAPSFARPGSVPSAPSQPGIQTLKPDVQAMNPRVATSTQPAARPHSTDPGSGSGSGGRGGRSSGLELPEPGDDSSTRDLAECRPVEDRRYGLTESTTAAFAEAGIPAPKVTVGSCSEETVAQLRGDALRELSSKLWKAGG